MLLGFPKPSLEADVSSSCFGITRSLVIDTINRVRLESLKHHETRHDLHEVCLQLRLYVARVWGAQKVPIENPLAN